MVLLWFIMSALFYMAPIIPSLLFSFQALSCFNSSSVIDYLCLQAASESIAERLKEKIMPFIPRVINECFSSHLSAIDPSSHQVASDQLVITSEGVINESDWLSLANACVLAFACMYNVWRHA